MVNKVNVTLKHIACVSTVDVLFRQLQVYSIIKNEQKYNKSYFLFNN